ncbi:TPA: hypothetical protein ACGW44_004606 [Bacillus toyonensis]
MTKKFRLSNEEEKQFNQFLATDDFAEILAIIWRYGSKRKGYFSIRNKKKEIPERFRELVVRSNSVRYCKREREGKVNFWEIGINEYHPLVKKIEEMNWTPISEKNRTFPKGIFNEKVFVATYIRLLHDLGTVHGQDKGKIYKRARLRIHGSVDVLNNIARVLHRELGVGLKRIQTDGKIPQAKQIYYQSKKEIPLILEFAGAIESLHRFYDFRLGYICTNELKKV